MEKIRELFLVSTLALVAVITGGYQFALSDQEIFIPYILKIQNSSLFKDDILFSQFSSNASVFYQLMAYVTNYINLETAFFMGYIFTKIIIFLGIYYLSKFIFKKKNIALLSLLPFLLPKFVGGTATYTSDNFFGYRSVGTIFLVFYLFFLFKKQFTKATILTGAALFFHPLSIIPNIMLSPILIIRDSKGKIKDLVAFATTITLSSIIYHHMFHLDSNLLRRSAEWLSIIKARDDYLFVSQWTILGWLSLLLYLTQVAIFVKYFKSRYAGTILVITISSLAIMFINFFVLDLAHFPAIAKFQLVRSISPIAIIGLAVSPYLLLFKKKYLKLLGFISFVALCLNLFYILILSVIGLLIMILGESNEQQHMDTKSTLAVATIVSVILILSITFSSNRVIFPFIQPDWQDVQIWAKQNSTEDTMFLVPPKKSGFRIFSQRAIVGDIKDGAVVIYSADYAFEWNQRMKKLTRYDELSKSDIYDLKKTYNINYMVTGKKSELDLPVVYQNDSYLIYKL